MNTKRKIRGEECGEFEDSRADQGRGRSTRGQYCTHNRPDWALLGGDCKRGGASHGTRPSDSGGGASSQKGNRAKEIQREESMRGHMC